MSGMWVLTRRATHVIALPRIVTFLQPNLFTRALASGPSKERNVCQTHCRLISLLTIYLETVELEP